MSAEIYLDSENVFRGAVPRQGAPRDGVPTAQAAVGPARATPRAGPPIAADRIIGALNGSVQWIQGKTNEKVSRIHSFGKHWDNSVEAMRDAVAAHAEPAVDVSSLQLNWNLEFDSIPISHQHVGRQPHAAETALIGRYDTRREQGNPPTASLVGSADKEAIVAFDHSANYDRIPAFVLLPSSHLNMVRHHFSEGRFPHIPARSVITVSEAIAGEIVRKARYGRIARERDRLASFRPLLGDLPQWESLKIARELAGTVRLDVISLGRAALKSARWERAVGERWVRDAVYEFVDNVASPEEAARYTTNSLERDEEVAIICRCIVWRTLAEHKQLTADGLAAYTNALQGTVGYERLARAVTEVVELRTPTV